MFLTDANVNILNNTTKYFNMFYDIKIKSIIIWIYGNFFYFIFNIKKPLLLSQAIMVLNLSYNKKKNNHLTNMNLRYASAYPIISNRLHKDEDTNHKPFHYP